MTAKEVTIYGAGMSGMVAAINLAREDYRVVVKVEEAHDFASMYESLEEEYNLDVAVVINWTATMIEALMKLNKDRPSVFRSVMDRFERS